MRGLTIDLFAGGGGASLALEKALGRPVDIALNHDPIALAVHKQNHPKTKHLEADIWSVRPQDVTRGRTVFALWASPDCTHFSNAKGAQPRKQNIRSLAWSVVRWAKATMPQFIFLENVTEFRKWGPLDEHKLPCKKRMGKTFRAWVRTLEKLGYTVDHNVLDASEYGAPTKRNRLFVVARRDGMRVTWPIHSHGVGLGLQPFKTAAECVDWTLPCPSIFGRKRPLAEKTLCRVAHGIRRFVLDCEGSPFIVKVNHGGSEFRGQGLDKPLSTVTAQRRGHALVTPFIAEPGQRHGRGQKSSNEPLSTIMAKDRHALVAPTLVQTGYGERPGQSPRVPGLHKPLGTMVNGQKHALVSAFLTKHFGDPRRKVGGGVVLGKSLKSPMGTITTRDHQSLTALNLCPPGQANNVEQVRAFLTAYYSTGSSHGQELSKPMRTIRTKHCLGLVTVSGIDYQINDIGLRMLQPHELLRAQFGEFADKYSLERAKTKASKVRLIGNSVCPAVAIAVIRANINTEAEERRAA